MDGRNVWGCGSRGTDTIIVRVTNLSKADLPDEFNGFKVVVEQGNKPVPLGK